MTAARRASRSVLALVAGLGLGLVLGGCGGAAPLASLPGDPRAGLSFYKYARCAACHALSNVSVGGGPDAGPALDGEGSRHDVAHLSAYLAAHLRQPAVAALMRQDGVVALTPAEQRDLVSYLATLR